MVAENIKEFESQFGEKAVHEVIAGDYTSQIETKFITGAPLDTCYAPPFMSNKWYAAGWIRNIEDMHPNEIVLYDVEDIKKELPKGILDAQLAAKDKTCLGLPYFCSTIGNLTTNELLLEKAGYADTKAKTSDYPKTYKELYERSLEMKKKGVAENPWEPRWGNQWYGYFSFLWENMARGDDLFDEQGNALFDLNTPALETLKDWRWLWDNDVVPKGLLTTDEGYNITLFATGKFAWSEHHTYDVKTFNDPAISKFAGYGSVAPPIGDQSVRGFLFAPIYICREQPKTANSPYRLARLHRMLQFMGNKDKNGKFYRHKSWIIETAVGSPYPAVYKDPDVVAAWKKWVYREQDIDTCWKLLEVARMNPGWKVIWFSNWQSVMNSLLPQVIQGTMTPEDCIKELKAEAERLKKQFGG